MNLNDTDKNRIIELIKAGEKLPKEYIYNLFSDEEDVFLFWNGRKEDVPPFKSQIPVRGLHSALIADKNIWHSFMEMKPILWYRFQRVYGIRSYLLKKYAVVELHT